MHRLVSPTAGNSAIHEGRQLGRDVLSRIIYGARVSVIIGLSATSVNLVVALLIGTTTGFFGGKLDMGSSGLSTPGCPSRDCSF